MLLWTKKKIPAPIDSQFIHFSICIPFDGFGGHLFFKNMFNSKNQIQSLQQGNNL